MGVRATHQFTSLTNTLYDVQIWDETWITASFDIRANGFTLQYHSDQGDTLLNPLISSDCDFLTFNDNTADWQSLIADLAVALEDQFKLVIWRFESAVWKIYWAGVIITDGISINNDNTPNEFKINAVDGLGRIKDIDFLKIFASPYTGGPQTLMKVVFDCLSYAGTAQFWATGTRPYIAVSQDWYDDQQSLTNNQRLLENVRIDPVLLARMQEPQDLGKTLEPLKVQDVLTNICRLLTARIILSQGTYHLQQVDKFNTTTYPQAEYDYLGVFTGMQTVAIRSPVGLGFSVLGDGVFSYYGALNKARIKSKPSPYIITTAATPPMTALLVNSATTPVSATRELGTIRGGAGLSLAINFRLKQDVDWVLAALGDLYLEAKFKFVCGSNRVLGTVGSPLLTWTTSAADLITRTYDVGTWGFDRQISIETPDLPFAVETGCTMQYTFTLKRYSGKALPAANAAAWLVSDFFIAALQDHQIINREIYEIVNPAGLQNSIELDLGELLITDTGKVSSKNTLEVQTTQSSGVWNQSGEWQAGFSVNTSLAMTIIRQAMALQRLPVPKYDGMFTGDYQAWKSIGYDGRDWVFTSGGFDARMDEWKGVWFGMTRSVTGINIPDTLDLPPHFDRDPVIKFPGQDGPLPPYKGLGDLIIPERGATVADVYLYDGSPITSMDIGNLNYSTYKTGDIIYILHPQTFQVLDYVELSADLDVGNTTIDFVSKALAVDIPYGAILTAQPHELVASAKGRFDTLEATGLILADPASPITITLIWAGSQAQYDDLGVYDSSTLYYIV